MKVEGGESRTKKGKERNEENLNGNLFGFDLSADGVQVRTSRRDKKSELEEHEASQRKHRAKRTCDRNR